MAELSAQKFDQLWIHKSIVVWYSKAYESLSFEVFPEAPSELFLVLPLHHEDQIGPIH